MEMNTGFVYKCFVKIETIFILIICAGLFLSVNGLIVNSQDVLITEIYFFYSIVSIASAYFMYSFLISKGIKSRMIFSMFIAFIIRFMACYYINISQHGDYGVYLQVAKNIYTGSFVKSLYYGIFPHALNYPIFISIVYKVIGNHTWIPKCINLLLEVIAVGLVVKIGEKSVNTLFGLIAGLALALNPSSIIFTQYAGGEPVYDVLIIISLMCVLELFSADRKKRMALIAAIGFISALADFLRPTGIVFVLATIMVLIFSDKVKVKANTICAAILIAVFFLFTFAFSRLTVSVSGYEQPSYSYGWNLFIGANVKSYGHWNAKDANLLGKIMSEKKDPSEIQKYFAGMGVQRYMDMAPDELVKHLKAKLSIWFDERYLSDTITGWQSSYTRFKSANTAQVFNVICFLYNSIVIVGALIAMLSLAVSKKCPHVLKLASLYLIGSIIFFVILESATRYKGAYYCMFTLIGAYGIYSSLQTIKTRIN